MGADPTERALPATRIVPLPAGRPLRCLSPRQVSAIDEALAQIGPFGEVRLVKNRGKLRFIQTVRSEEIALED